MKKIIRYCFEWFKDKSGHNALLKMFLLPDKIEADEAKEQVLQKSFKTGKVDKDDGVRG